MKNGIDHQDVYPLCRLCKEKVQSVTHIFSSGSFLAGNQCRNRHDKLAKKNSGFSAGNLRLNVKKNGSYIKPEPVLENSKCKTLRDFGIQSDKEKELQRIDIVVTDKEKRECKVINIAILGDQNIKVKELEEIAKFQDFRLHVQIFWDVKVTVKPTIVGALGTVSCEVESNLKTIGISIVKSCLLKAGLLGRPFILRELLSISESWKLSNVKAFF